LTYSGQLTVLVCWCGMRHAVPEELHDTQLRQHRDGGRVMDIYCPLGHAYIPSGKGEATRLREQLEQQRREAGRLAAERDQIQASLRAQKAATTRAKKRSAAAVCPCCHRSFSQLRRHMQSKHPGYDPSETTVG
jgi:hypothetical protein